MSRYNRRTYSRFTDPFEFNIEYKNRYGFQPYIMIDRLMKNNRLTHAEAFFIVNEQMGVIWKEQREKSRLEAQRAIFHDVESSPFDTEEEKETVDSPYLTEDNLSFPGDDSAWEQMEFIL